MRRIVFAMASALLLLGCTGEAETETVFTPEPTPVPEMSEPVNPDAVLPPMPEQARADNTEGAVFFVRYYVDVQNYAALTGDTTELRRLSDSGCEACMNYVHSFDERYANGGYFKGLHWDFEDVEFRPGHPESYLTTEVTTTSGTAKLTADDDEFEVEGSVSTVTFGVVRGSPWRITRIGLGRPE